MDKKQRMSIYFTPELLEQVRQSAAEHHRSFNQEVISILDRVLNREKNRQKAHDLQMQVLKRTGERLMTPELEERFAKDELWQAWLEARKAVDDE
jgi:hypothetical protein